LSAGRGVLFGTTTDGGQLGVGTVFALTPPASPGIQWANTLLYSWDNSDGSSPSGVVIGSAGVLYGATSAGGTFGYGTVYALQPPASPGLEWTKTVLHNFAGGAGDGASPSGVVIGGGGVLYGTTSGGGVAGDGTVFAVRPPSSPTGVWIEEVLHSFKGFPSDGSQPLAGVAVGNDGVLYGTTSSGGTAAIGPGCAAQLGGSSDCPGAIFSLAPPSSPGGGWNETLLYSTGEDGFANGFEFVSGVVIGEGGVLYGVSPNGGLYCAVLASGGCGVVYELKPPSYPGGAWTDTVLHAFTGAPNDAINPGPGLAIGKGGALYGASYNGGASEDGTVYALDPTDSGPSWTETVIYSFEWGSASGSSPSTTVTIGSDGLIYGTTTYGGVPGPFGCGTIFSLK